MSTRHNALGRGIGALLPGAGPAAAPGTPGTPPGGEPGVASGGPAAVPVDQIDPNPDQPRQRFEAEQLEQLANSVRKHGVLQPVVVRRAGERYELVVGERRWRACRAAGLASIPAVVMDVEPRDRHALALVENVQRRDLNPIELAHAFRALSDGGVTHEEIGRRVGLERSTVANHLRLLDLPRELQEDVELGRLTAGHAKALLQMSNPERRRQLRDRVVKDGLSVRAAEDLARTQGGPAASAPRSRRTSRDPNLERVVDQLRQRLQTRVRIQGGAARGRIEVEYFGAEDLQRIVSVLLGEA